MRPDPVSSFLRRPDDETSAQLVEAARNNSLEDQQVADLAVGLARSGLELPQDPRSADIASTGGPSSLSTLLCPLFLRARGLRVPKLGIPGRPAGGVDVLQTIPGFDAAIDLEAARTALARSGYVHLISDERWAPLDRCLFAYRQRSGSQAIPSLVIASILAKKIAAGVVGAGLEVRIASHGNFGEHREVARENARRYKDVAARLGLRAVAFLTDASRPFQPYIGRGEALVALDRVIEGRAVGWLADHVELCRAMADSAAATLGTDVSLPVPTSGLRHAQDALLACHRTSASAFDARVARLQSAPRTTFSAPTTGFPAYDLGRLRDLLVARQLAEVSVGGTVPDPAGVVLLARPGLRVTRGTPLISVRVGEGEQELTEALGACADIAVQDPIGLCGDNDFETI